MSKQEDNEELADLQKVNADLSSSLDRCRALLRECRTKLAANSDEEDVSAPDKRHG